jgi:hypothetical protein
MKTISVALSFITLLVLLPVTSYSAPNRKVTVGETVTLDGILTLIDGEDIQEKPMKYQAIKLIKPINIIYEDGEAENVGNLKLWFNSNQTNLFDKWSGKNVHVTGTVEYYWFGPSTMPNPAKLQVIEIKSR